MENELGSSLVKIRSVRELKEITKNVPHTGICDINDNGQNVKYIYLSA